MLGLSLRNRIKKWTQHLTFVLSTIDIQTVSEENLLTIGK